MLNPEDEDEDPCLCDPCDCDISGPGGEQSTDVGRSSIEFDLDADAEYEGEGLCTCDPCECETPPGSPVKPVVEAAEETEAVEVGNAFQLDEFMRAKAYFLNTSLKSGVNLYDHLSDVIRKLLDERGPNNPVDYFEEVSMNVKRYRFQQGKDILEDVFYISEPIINDARFLTENWKKYSTWSAEKKEIDGEGGFMGGSFQNLLRLQYYLEQVNIGLPREEMFRIALAIRDLTSTRTFISRARFWGKIFGIEKSYFVVEADFKTPGSGDADIWQPGDETQEENVQESAEMKVMDEKVPGPEKTLERAGNVVLDHDFLSAYSKTSGLPPEKQAQLLPKPKSIPAAKQNANPYNTEMYGEDGEAQLDTQPQMMEFQDADAVADFAKWQGYQEELMTKFPGVTEEEEAEVPPEVDGTGVNRRAFYVCNTLGSEWTLLPNVTPKQINDSRFIRWCLTGNLNAKIATTPIYPGKEGHYLKALLARAASGSLVSPKGFYKSNKFAGEDEGEDDEDIEEEEEESTSSGDDKVFPSKKYTASMSSLTDPKLTFWVHHAGYILPQGRYTWWNPARSKNLKKNNEETSEDESEEEDEFEGEGQEVPGGAIREVGPPRFSPVSNDIAADGRAPFTLQTSSSVFTEFQVASLKSNTWPGSAVICTVKGKVDNIYLGDGLKFADHTYAPPMTVPACVEYRVGPEIEEFPDPSVEEEQKWLNRLELNQIGDIEPKFVDNEDDTGDEEQEEESDEDY